MQDNPKDFKKEFEPRSLAQYIDHTLLRPDAKESEIVKLCEEAKAHHFKTVCIEARWLGVAVNALKGSEVLPITVIAFPSGNGSFQAKAEETRLAVEAGAKEIDMVLNRTLLKEKDYAGVLRDISSVVGAASGLPVKVILETSELTQEEKRIASALAKAAGAAFVKTSTGFSKSGASEVDIQLMRETVGPEMGVKASGGVRTFEDAVKLIRAGANRLGASASVAIVQKSSGNEKSGY